MMETVLIVDDDLEIREALALMFAEEGYSVLTAANGAEALALIHRMAPHPCVMILDMMMPVMTGGELLEVLERSQGLAKLPVVVLTAATANPERARTVIRKPASMTQIVAAVRSAFDEPPSSEPESGSTAA